MNKLQQDVVDFLIPIEKKMGLVEAILTVKNFDHDEYKNTGGPKEIKKMKLKYKVQKSKGYMGSDIATFTGQEKDLVAYAQKYLDADGKSNQVFFLSSKCGYIASHISFRLLNFILQLHLFDFFGTASILILIVVEIFNS
jgi:hypothetical protein